MVQLREGPTHVTAAGAAVSCAGCCCFLLLLLVLLHALVLLLQLLNGCLALSSHQVHIAHCRTNDAAVHASTTSRQAQQQPCSATRLLQPGQGAFRMCQHTCVEQRVVQVEHQHELLGSEQPLQAA
jgi:hypothetical protein